LSTGKSLAMKRWRFWPKKKKFSQEELKVLPKGKGLTKKEV